MRTGANRDGATGLLLYRDGGVTLGGLVGLVRRLLRRLLLLLLRRLVRATCKLIERIGMSAVQSRFIIVTLLNTNATGKQKSSLIWPSKMKQINLTIVGNHRYILQDRVHIYHLTSRHLHCTNTPGLLQNSRYLACMVDPL